MTLSDVTVHKVIPSNTNLQSFSSVNSVKQIVSRDRHQQSSNTFFSILKNSSNQRFGKKSSDRKKRQIPDTAFLVLSDGCRNPVYRSVAAGHPIQDSDDNLVVRFNFKAFMFQDMNGSGFIRITAKVIACVEEEDCQPVSYELEFCSLIQSFVYL